MPRLILLVDVMLVAVASVVIAVGIWVAHKALFHTAEDVVKKADNKEESDEWGRNSFRFVRGRIHGFSLPTVHSCPKFGVRFGI